MLNKQDKRLHDAVSLFGDKDWVNVAAHVGHGVTNERCVHRWQYYLRPELKDRKLGPWSVEEVELMMLPYSTVGDSI